MGTSKIANTVPPIELSSPYLAIPTSSNSCAGPSAATPIRSPSRSSSSSATPSSTTTSPLPLGQRPSTRLSGLKRSNSGAVSMPNARDGAPPVSISSPSGRSSFVWKSETDPVAISTLDRADSLERLLRDRRRLRRLALEAEAGVLPGHDGVRPGVRVDEDRVEGLVDRVREDVAAAHHRDAEHDRERGEHRAQLAAGQALECEPDHVPTIQAELPLLGQAARRRRRFHCRRSET